MIVTVTEEEAKTKRCQESFPAAEALSQEGTVESVAIAPAQMVSFGSTAIQVGGAYGYARHTAPTHCIGSACMAWRWKRGSLYVPDPLHDNHFTEYEGKGEYSATHGYCGKAGKP